MMRAHGQPRWHHKLSPIVAACLTALLPLWLAQGQSSPLVAPEAPPASPEHPPTTDPQLGRNICAALEAIADGITIDRARSWLPQAEQLRTRRALSAVLDVAVSAHVSPEVQDIAWQTLLVQTGRDDIAHDRDAFTKWIRDGLALTDAAFAQWITAAHATRAVRLAALNEQTEAELARVYHQLYERTPEDQRQDLLVVLIGSPRTTLQATGLDLADREALSARPLSDAVIETTANRLTSPRASVRTAAARLLTRIDASTVVNRVVHALGVETDVQAAAAQLRVLQRHPQVLALPSIVRWLASPSTGASDGAAAALLALQDRTPIPDPARTSIVEALRAMRDEQITADGVSLLYDLAGAKEIKRFLHANRADVVRAACLRLARDSASLTDVLDAARADPSLFDIAITALSNHQPTAEGYQLAKALPSPSEESHSSGLASLASGMYASELLRAAHMEPTLTTRIDLLSAGLTPERLSHLRGTDPGIFARREAVAELLRLRIETQAPRAALDLVESITDPEAALIFESQRVTALVMLNRLDEAVARHQDVTPGLCDAWLEALSQCRHLDHAPHVAARIETLFSTILSDMQRARLDALRTAIPKTEANASSGN